MTDDLWQGFLTPPASARPRVWWHWMNGNVDARGVRLDLEWMARVGIGGAQVFEGGMGTPQVVEERLVYHSEPWRDAFRTAVATAGELGLDLTIATSAGWSAAGGPWVEPGDAMKRLVWSEVVVRGGRPVRSALPPLPDGVGLYADSPRWGDTSGLRFARDAVTIAFPADDAQVPLVPDAVSTSDGTADTTPLTDGSFATSVVLPRDPDADSTGWVLLRFAEPVTVRAVTAGLPGPHGFGSPPPAVAVLEAGLAPAGAADDVVTYRPVAELPASPSPVRTVAFPPVTATHVRLRLSGPPAASALPPMGDGVAPPPRRPTPASFQVSELALYADGRVSAAPEKAGFAPVPDYHAVATDPSAVTRAIDPDSVRDVSDHVDADGVLHWEAPEGDWRVLRFGYSLTGHRNGPAPDEATGLEVDKLDARRIRAYLEHHLDLYRATVGGPVLGDHGLASLLSDSIESGPQTWTEGLPGDFARRRGYDLTAWLPALAGYAVGDAARSDAFLWDYRRTLADLVADYYATVAAVAHENGLTYYAEALEDHRPQLGDDLEMRHHADVPMGAMWTFPAGGTPLPTYVADLVGASSVAHVYGKRFTGAESLSAFGHPWEYAPRSLKHVADLELALGVTRFCLHTSPHQPSGVRPPGIALAPTLGQTFDRNETWAELARDWVTYLGRCSWVLNQGRPVADVALFPGEEAPVTAVWGDRAFDVPTGYGFDVVGAHALAHALSVADDGRVETIGGASYRLIALDGSSDRMTVGTLERLLEMVRAGATLVGSRPSGSPSLADDPARFAAAADALWGSGLDRESAGPDTGSAGERRDDSARDDAGRVVGRGRVVTASLHDAVVHLGLAPDWAASAEVLVNHRALPDRDVWFVANPQPRAVSVHLSVPTAGTRASAWDPVTGTRRPVAGRSADGRLAVVLDLASCGSVLLVVDHADAVRPDPGPVDATAVVAAEADFPARRRTRTLTGPWRVRFDPDGDGGRVLEGAELRSWTESDEDDVRYFSGTAEYRHELALPPDLLGPDASVVVDLGEVRELATVAVNGVDLGVLWTPPFAVDVSAAVRPGVNELVVRVTNTWANRLIGDARTPGSGVTQTTGPTYLPDAPLLPAGLLGPVTVTVAS